ncbi:MAG: hypothetical protein F6K47_21105 [Symploca sp. SIO2E6]|nr:hypothetical protein [Symploca sp. SIO2E6]
MVSLGASAGDTVAVLGPTIAQRSYEVAPTFPDNLAGTGLEPMDFLVPSENEGHWMFDLPALIRAQLSQLVGSWEVMDQDTYSQESLFFSYRRATHRSEPDYGRQISGICLHD